MTTANRFIILLVAGVMAILLFAIFSHSGAPKLTRQLQSPHGYTLLLPEETEIHYAEHPCHSFLYKFSFPSEQTRISISSTFEETSLEDLARDLDLDSPYHSASHITRTSLPGTKSIQIDYVGTVFGFPDGTGSVVSSGEPAPIRAVLYEVRDPFDSGRRNKAFMAMYWARDFGPVDKIGDAIADSFRLLEEGTYPTADDCPDFENDPWSYPI